MNRFHHIVSLLLMVFLLLTNDLYSQEITFTSNQFNTDADYKTAKSNIKQAEYFFYISDFYQALEYYEKVNELLPDNAALNFKIGICYYETSMKFKCLTYFENAFQLNRNIHPEIHFMLGRGFHLNTRFDEALNEYKAHMLTKDNNLPQQPIAINTFIKQCETGKLLLNAEPNAFVDNLGLTVNSPFNDHSPLITADETNMIFTSTRNNGSKIATDGQYDEDLYLSTKNGKIWSIPQSMGVPVNTQFNDATVGLSPDGQKLLIYNGNRGNGDIQICWLNGDEWNYPKNLPNEINSEFKESSACFSPDGKKFYFTSDRPNGMGGIDIYVSSQYSNGKWSQAENLGPMVNSEFNEESVFMHPDGRTLYFSSDGENSSGGYDIFVTHLKTDGSWTKPENLGYPVNSPDDDLCFVISANGRRGYCSSVRPDSYGGLDIYQMTFLGPPKPVMLTTEHNLLMARQNPVSYMALDASVELKTIRLTIVKGRVLEDLSQLPVEAQIDIVDNEKNEVIFTSNTNSQTGKFLVSLPSGKNYGLIVNAEGYLFFSENFDIPSTTEYQEIEKDIQLSSLKKDAKVIMRNVFFESGSAVLKSASYGELDRLVTLLINNPRLKIEVSGHTDNVGNANSNMKLSNARAESVVNYLLAKGIDSSRLTFKGYGFLQSVAENTTADGRAQNRRVEFKVLEN